MALPALVQCFDDALRRFGAVELAASLQRRNTGSFGFGPVVAVPEQHWIKAPFEAPLRFISPVISPAPSGLGVSVTLPEWTASAVGWVLGIVTDAARGGAPDVPNFAVRVTRVR